MKSEWIGDKQNGVEFRYEGGDEPEPGLNPRLDEVCVYVDGKCVVHSERMGDDLFWMGVYTEPGNASVTFASRSGRAAVVCRGELDT